jgi:hypothetical protein
MEKRLVWRGLVVPFLFFLLRLPSALFVTSKDPSARRRQVTERSERTVEEAENNPR